ncbi:MAG: hypothetical protein C5B50_08480 [Verrucomicrobia bacterium]|nr:MAG: hypothetical protein C5B50_08480 [Verrucomicrobiota bacterium]
MMAGSTMARPAQKLACHSANRFFFTRLIYRISQVAQGKQLTQAQKQRSAGRGGDGWSSLLQHPSFASTFSLRLLQCAVKFWGMTVAENKFLKEAIKQGLRMQHRFSAKPVLARTGRGYLKSEGVTTLQRIKAGMK